MSNLPNPLTPPDCDLRDFAFMPLDVARLRDSDLAAYESPEACWAGVLLWCTAWHQLPAASLPDDDRFLAKAAGYGRVVKEWLAVREGALHGWVKCADGRLYHPVVAEKAVESWKAKLHHQWKKECDRIRKSNKQREQEGKQPLPFPPEPTFDASETPKDEGGIPPEENGIPTEPNKPSGGGGNDGAGNPQENLLKGEGQGQGEGQGEYKNPSHLSVATVVNPETPPADEKRGEERPAEPKRHVDIAVLLRKAGVKPFTFAHPFAMEWAGNPKVTDELLTAAVQQARDYKPTGDISPNYLKPIIEQLLNPPEPKPAKQPQDSWWLTNAGIERKGRELGMFARGTESHNDFKDRIFEEIRKRGGKAA